MPGGILPISVNGTGTGHWSKLDREPCSRDTDTKRVVLLSEIFAPTRSLPAWYWGGSAGLAVAGIGIMLATMPWAAAYQPIPIAPGRDDPAAWMATGAFIMMVLMLAGYGVAWAWWWLSRGR